MVLLLTHALLTGPFRATCYCSKSKSERVENVALSDGCAERLNPHITACVAPVSQM
jgi:hypothetical protein